MRKGFWDRLRANNANCYWQRNMWRKVVSASNKTIFGIIQRFFAAVLSEKDESNVDTWEV